MRSLVMLALLPFVALVASCGKSTSAGAEGPSVDASAPADAALTLDSSAPTGDAATPAGDGSTPGSGNACEVLGGLCLGQASVCTNGGGTVSAAGASGCVFSDGAGVCCIPPAAQATGTDCRSHGGLCAPIAGCNFTHGNFAPPSCTGLGVGVVCCVPQKICGEETVACCNDMTTFRPACDRGTFVCTISGTTLKPREQCP